MRVKNEGKKKKTRSSGSDTLNFLREKNEQVQEMQKQELELKRQQLEIESRKQENFMHADDAESAATTTKANAGFSGDDECPDKTAE